MQYLNDSKLFIINRRRTSNREIFAVLQLRGPREIAYRSAWKFNKIRSPDAPRSLCGGGKVECASRFRRLHIASPHRYSVTPGDNLPLFASRVGWIIRRAENGLSKSMKDCFQKRTTLYFDVVCAFRRTWEHVKQFRIIFLERCARILPLWLTLLRFRCITSRV